MPMKAPLSLVLEATKTNKRVSVNRKLTQPKCFSLLKRLSLQFVSNSGKRHRWVC